MVIKGYHYLIRDNKISPEIILDKPEHFFEVTKEYFNILKIHLLMKLMIMCEIINLLIEMIHLM
ncbi:hypothetical protein DQW15_01020 [Mycoplasma capricolum subsp. capripneumoniae]|nr:hypothetical protein DQW15_01020 [Mycoplasma capricolum subsp. capripneumoniae]QDL20106.1 hypothetical protein DQW16_01020 [Mycoplasma capricolum subsp. capripneumoniae]QDL20792.1 hypothetical protein DQW17_01020 [Mycoplasma capricolum subsp. capripneumoniae]